MIGAHAFHAAAEKYARALLDAADALPLVIPALAEELRFEELLEALELGSLCAHGSGMPAPLRSLLAHFPDELGLAG